ncbi:TIGR04086 family membrane protein [Fusibacillus kribbianus]|uniref:TIGR04086 family membrane protein n=1 Tax=Fusibacillus kribbianus TaxID=3044208 RepID=A0AAP4EXA7_9FIRM|nr:TIGR04086 family membrane protein [Ruminococcus sp. YH-rum2234]MDI9241587.1 TIGR04086 family membrane protein [Ruminococcus sp. YH-rum2234]
MASIPKSKPLYLLRSLLLSYVLSGLLLLLLSFLLYKMKLSRDQIQAGVYIIYVLSCFFGGFLSGKQLKTRRFLWGGLSGLLYFGILLLLSLLLGKGIQSGLSRLLLSLGLCAGSGVIGGMLS